MLSPLLSGMLSPLILSYLVIRCLIDRSRAIEYEDNTFEGHFTLSLLFFFRSYTHSLWDLLGKVTSLLGLKILIILKLRALSFQRQEIWARFSLNWPCHLIKTVLSWKIMDISCSFFHLQAELTSIVLKRNVTMLDIASTRMLGQFGFLAKVRKLMPDVCYLRWLKPSQTSYTHIRL